jgi:methionine-gamma-lyase
MSTTWNPLESLAAARHEFGEHGGVNPSIEASTTFTVMHARTLPELFHGQAGPEQGCYLYGRHLHPTVLTLGKQLAAIEGTETGYATASGMGAISSTLLQVLGPGDTLVASEAIYGGTYAFIRHWLAERIHVDVRWVDVTDHRAVAEACVGAKLLYTESISNPTLIVADLPQLAGIAHRAGARLAVDNTFAPLLVSPARLGADIVLHSLTKYISGSSDVIAGAVCASDAFVHEILDPERGALMLLGPTLDSRLAFELALRLPHLGLRIAEHSHRAQVFAERLNALGLHVLYPGLPEHPQHELLAAISNPGFGCGGILSLDVGSAETATALLEDLQNEERFGYIAVSLGYFDTLLSQSAQTTSSELDDGARSRTGLSSGLIRLSVGYTGSLEQRWEQLERSLRRVGIVGRAA